MCGKMLENINEIDYYNCKQAKNYYRPNLSFINFVRKTKIDAKLIIATNPRIIAKRNQFSPFSILTLT